MQEYFLPQDLSKDMTSELKYSTIIRHVLVLSITGQSMDTKACFITLILTWWL